MPHKTSNPDFRFSSYFFDEGRFSNKNYNYLFFFLVEKKTEKYIKKIKNRKAGFEVLLGIRCRFQNCPFFVLALMVFDFYYFIFLNTPQKHENRNFLKN